MNRNYHAPVGNAGRTSRSWPIKVGLLAVGVLAVAVMAFRDSGRNDLTQSHSQTMAPRSPISAASLSLPLYFEPNEGQTDSEVKFLARGAGYGLFLTNNEAVLSLERQAAKNQPGASNAIRMRLEGASPSATIQGTQALPGKSSYFIGNNPAKWHRNIPQFGRVEYANIYPGIDLDYYGKDRQLEYDFRVTPGADPDRILLSFEGASARLESGDLVLTTSGGAVRFHAPHVYQLADSRPADEQSSANQAPVADKKIDVAGSFRLLAGNKIGFAVGPYDRSRELVIDPVLTYSTYLGSGVQPVVQVAVDTADNIYFAGSTTSAYFFPSTSIPPYSSALGGSGAQNVFIGVLNSSGLQYATYLGGSGIDTLAGLAIDPKATFPSINIYVAGTTTSTNFPTVNAFQSTATFNAGEVHGFVSRLNPSAGIGSSGSASAELIYSTYLAGTNAAGTSSDTVTGLAVDATQDAYVAGITTSTDGPGNSSGFPSNSFAYQPCPYGPPVSGSCPTTGTAPQFFASKIDTSQSGVTSMLYSTYFGGGNGNTTVGGGVAVDTSDNMYFTGATNMQNSGTDPYPILNAYQGCLNQPGVTTNCTPTNTTSTDAILVKLNPSQSEPGAPPFYSTYLGGSSNDVGIAVAVDSSNNAYVTGSTTSGDWSCISPCVPGPNPPFGFTDTNATNAFIAKITNEGTGSTIYPLGYFAWLGGSIADGGGTIGQSIAVDTVGSVHLAGSTSSLNLPYNFCFDTGQCSLQNYIQAYQGGGDAFVALIAPSTVTAGDFVTYLGGSAADQASGVAVDINNNTFVSGTTASNNFLVTNGSTLTAPAPDAFVAQISSNSNLVASSSSGSPFPSPVAAGQQAAFTFNLVNNGPNPATNINFFAVVPTGFTITPTAKIDSGIGTCDMLPEGGNTIPCFIESLAVGGTATVEVDITPPAPPPGPLPYPVSVSCSFSSNGGTVSTNCPSQTDNAVDFTIAASPPTITIDAGEIASFPVTLTPEPTYDSSITMSETTSPSIVTSTTPTFTNPTVTLDGSTAQTTTLNIATVARPVTTGRLFRKNSFYATWLPIGGLSLTGLGIGFGRRRRRWMIGSLLVLVAGLMLLQPACSSNSSSITTNQGTAAGVYFVTIKGAASTNASHQTIVKLQVN